MWEKILDYIIDWVLDISGYNEKYSDLYSYYTKAKNECNILTKELNFLKTKGMDCETYKKFNDEIALLKQHIDAETDDKWRAIEKLRELDLFYKDAISVCELQDIKNGFAKELESLKEHHKNEISQITLERNNVVTKAKSLEYEVEQLKILTKNPLGAGRKERGTKQEINRILELRNNCSLGQIANIMTKETGDNWCKSTVKNIINRANQ
jgi:hypothetical protein